MSEKSKTLKISVGVVTRNRPRMLQQLLGSWARMTLPENAEVSFLVVENDSQLTIAEVVEEFKTKLPNAKVTYDLETALGIPSARNRLLRLAIDEGSDFLAMMDDDEVVDQNWLVALFGEQQRRDLDLVGGPVRTDESSQKLSFIQKINFRGLVSRAERVERNALNLFETGQDQFVTIVTNNWLCRLKFLLENEIWFDRSLAFSGGSDTKIYRAIQAHGGKTGWAPNAIVSEEIPVSRLSPRYHFKRGRDQSIAAYWTRENEGRKFLRLRLAVTSVIRVFSGIVRLLLVPFTRGRSFILAMRSFGASVGCILALFGRRSEHYRNVAGD